MMNTEKVIAGIAVGAGALFLIYKGEYLPAGTLLGAMVGFFTGDSNGFKNGVRSVKEVIV